MEGSSCSITTLTENGWECRRCQHHTKFKTSALIHLVMVHGIALKDIDDHDNDILLKEGVNGQK